DLLLFGLDWVAREAVRLGMSREVAWSMGSLHPATRFARDGDIGGLGGGRRADIVLLDDGLNVGNTWYGGGLVVEHRKIAPVLDEALSRPYRYPERAYRTVHVEATPRLTPDLPKGPAVVNAIGITLPGIVLPHEKVKIEPAGDWAAILKRHDLN